jgi:hypothetical protein
MPAIKAEFGADFITSEGALDRKRMRDLAFHDPAAKQRLEAIIHPLVGQTTGSRPARPSMKATPAWCSTFHYAGRVRPLAYETEPHHRG